MVGRVRPTSVECRRYGQPQAPEATPCPQGVVARARPARSRAAPLDIIGLALVAFAAFFACVFYLGWAGGEVGEALAGAILFTFGGVGYLAPVLMFAAGAVIVVRPMIPALHPLKTGVACLTSALMLGLAAGSLGLGPGHTARDGFLDPHYLKHHGGLVGESLLWTSAKLFSTAGSHILFVFLLLAGILLLTGASIASIVTATREAAASTTERVRRTAATERVAYEPLSPIAPPEPEDREPVVRATHVEVPVQDEPSDYPELDRRGGRRGARAYEQPEEPV